MVNAWRQTGAHAQVANMDTLTTLATKNHTPRFQNRRNKSNKASGASAERQSLSITPQSEDYSAWYHDLITAADMIDNSPVRGCIVMKPWAMSVWELLKRDLDERITSELQADNAYFPLLIPKSFLSKEAHHVDGFAKECAVVTHHRLVQSEDGTDLIPDPSAKLDEPLVVRPTSETIIWNMFQKWIHSHRDLPMKINQWANVVRWELRTRPFLRGAEFLWQEGHTAHATSDEAIDMAKHSLNVYASTCEEMLAMPVIKGLKSPSERFAGANDTYTIEALMGNGWALQSGTSHYLGQNFAKAFDVKYQNDTNDGIREYVWATSWGVSTRLIGALIMTHSDDNGLVLPPTVAPIQVIIIPINSDKNPNIIDKVNDINNVFKANKTVRMKVDDRTYIRPGAKFFEWERKGVPIRLDVGPRDISNGTATIALRHTGEKITVNINDMEILAHELGSALCKIQGQLLSKAKQRLNSKIFSLNKYDEMTAMLSSKDKEQLGMYLVPWTCNADNEAIIKTECKATIRCYPLEHNQTPPDDGVQCFYSGKQATHYAIFARAF